MNACPLCHAAEISSFHQDRHRRYFRCQRCWLVFVPPTHFLSPQAEKTEYDMHQNSPGDQGYRRFLGRLFAPMADRLAANSSGLDFGAGPGPTLSLMFEEAGHQMEIFDPFYAPDAGVFERRYDFITASEVVEHLHQPRQELDRLWALLKPGGYLGIMTKLALGRSAFAGWHYKDDLTHVCFFSRTSFTWLTERWGARLTFSGKDVVILRKAGPANG